MDDGVSRVTWAQMYIHIFINFFNSLNWDILDKDERKVSTNPRDHGGSEYETRRYVYATTGSIWCTTG